MPRNLKISEVFRKITNFIFFFRHVCVMQFLVMVCLFGFQTGFNDVGVLLWVFLR